MNGMTYRERLEDYKDERRAREEAPPEEGEPEEADVGLSPGGGWLGSHETRELLASLRARAAEAGNELHALGLISTDPEVRGMATRLKQLIDTLRLIERGEEK